MPFGCKSSEKLSLMGLEPGIKIRGRHRDGVLRHQLVDHLIIGLVQRIAGM